MCFLVTKYTLYNSTNAYSQFFGGKKIYALFIPLFVHTIHTNLAIYQLFFVIVSSNYLSKNVINKPFGFVPSSHPRCRSQEGPGQESWDSRLHHPTPLLPKPKSWWKRLTGDNSAPSLFCVQMLHPNCGCITMVIQK